MYTNEELLALLEKAQITTSLGGQASARMPASLSTWLRTKPAC